MHTIQHTILHLSLIDHVGPVLIDHLVKQLTLEHFMSLYDMNVNQLIHHYSLTSHQAHLICDGLKNTQILHAELEACAKNNIQWTTRYDENYPSSLISLHAPPTVLYWQGKNPLEYTKNISFIGSRQANWYAKEVMHLLIPPLLPQGFAVVSGGAIGADTLAHQETLKANGSTIAVLGSGLLQPYPRQNIKLFKEIIEKGGTVLSPFQVNTAPLPGNFPARNRIIAGLSQAVIIVQAAQKSGTLITAQFALEQGIEVGVVPGLITDPLSAGCHDLIKQGACIITSSDDILAMLGQAVSLPNPPESKETDPLILACSQPKTIDELVVETALSPLELQEKLICLQIEGKITQDFLGRWQRSN
jgi:DNA processing protein